MLHDHLPCFKIPPRGEFSIDTNSTQKTKEPKYRYVTLNNEPVGTLHPIQVLDDNVGDVESCTEEVQGAEVRLTENVDGEDNEDGINVLHVQVNSVNRSVSSGNGLLVPRAECQSNQNLPPVERSSTNLVTALPVHSSSNPGQIVGFCLPITGVNLANRTPNIILQPFNVGTAPGTLNTSAQVILPGLTAPYAVLNSPKTATAMVGVGSLQVGNVKDSTQFLPSVQEKGTLLSSPNSSTINAKPSSSPPTVKPNKRQSEVSPRGRYKLKREKHAIGKVSKIGRQPANTSAPQTSSFFLRTSEENQRTDQLLDCIQPNDVPSTSVRPPKDVLVSVSHCLSTPGRIVPSETLESCSNPDDSVSTDMKDVSSSSDRAVSPSVDTLFPVRDVPEETVQSPVICTSKSSVGVESQIGLSSPGEKVRHDPGELTKRPSSECGSVLRVNVSPPRSTLKRLLDKQDVADLSLKAVANTLLTSSANETVSPTDPYYRYKVCRLCFKTGQSLTSIFGTKFHQFDIKEVIEELLPYKVSKLDVYPQQICELCLVVLVKFKCFKDKFLEDKKLFDEELAKHKQAMDKEENLRPSEVTIQGETESVSIERERMDHQYSLLDDNCTEVGLVLSKEDSTGTNPVVQLVEKSSSNAMDETIDGDDVAPSASAEQLDSSPDETEDENSNDGDLETTIEDVSPPKKVSTRRAKVEGVFPCSICDQVFMYQNHKDDHMKEHEKNFPFQCTDCDRRYQTLLKLNHHIICHSNYKPYECEICGKRFKIQISLRRHKETHGNEMKYLCPHCGKAYREYTNFNRHMKGHQLKKAYICDICRKEFSHGDKLIRHMVVHSDSTPHVCEICNRRFALKRRLTLHMSRMHRSDSKSTPVEEHNCDICQKAFSDWALMTEHRRWHFGNQFESPSKKSNE
ncbi:uncharacterized protein [Hetaerina americana]|uniref:uncharacterized protein isoform X2 n=1 Tax=Hetaerina americana TaxID=62018 RepID=UPI003A7F491D